MVNITHYLILTQNKDIHEGVGSGEWLGSLVRALQRARLIDSGRGGPGNKNVDGHMLMGTK